MYRTHFWQFLNLPTDGTCFDDPPPEGGAPGGGGGAGDKKFTQADMDATIRTRLAEAEERWNKRQKPGPTAEELKELEDLRKGKIDRERLELESKGRYDAALKSKDDEFTRERESFKAREKRLNDRLVDRTVKAALVAAAAELGAHSPDAIASLLGMRVRLTEEFEPEVLEVDLKTPAFKAGKPLTPAELVAQYLDDNAWLRKPAGTGGSGSPGGKSTDAEDAGEKEVPANIKQLQADFDALDKKAKASSQPADLTRAHQAKRKLEAAQKEAAKK